MPGMQIADTGYVAQLLGNAQALTDTAASAVGGGRFGRYGERMVQSLFPTNDNLGLEGSMWVGANQTPANTGYAYAIQTSFSATVALATLYNSDSPQNPNAKSLILKHIHLLCTAAGSTTTSSHAVCAIDNGNRFTSVSSGLTPTPQNMNGNVGPTGAKGVMNFGNITAAAASGSVRYTGRKILKVNAAPCWVIGDVILMTFGAYEHPAPLAWASSATQNIQNVIPFGPHIIGPNQTFVLHMFNPANATTAPSFEVEAVWVER